MSSYDDMLVRQGQPDEEDDSDTKIAEGAEAARELRRLLDWPEEERPEEAA